MEINMNLQEKSPEVEEVKLEILEFCKAAQPKENILKHIGIELRPYNYKKYISRLVEDRYLQYTIPHNPRSNVQQYITSKKGLAYLKAVE
ncbi:hypothetical protein [Adhaeribacter aquaticus]|uniref:hypothetical protein n=1 Tax=Adhaeribacter aquaticus TaxID=299567 RepID=UPI00040104EA|nr:hypothetical protein [Adhaeribacter aquaticus]